MTKHSEQNIRYLLSTFAVEGLKPSNEAMKLYTTMSDKKITLSEVLKVIERNHGVSGTPSA